jgi:hypothetical protein
VMRVAQAILGVACLLVGIRVLARRSRLAERAKARGNATAAAPAAWAVVGTLMTANGLLQLLLAAS